MRNVHYKGGLLFALSLTLLLASCNPKSPADPVDITAEIQELNQGFVMDFENGNAAGLAARYTEDGTLYPPNSEVLRGREAITGYWQATVDAGVKASNMRTERATAYGDAAVEVGTVDILTTDGQLVDRSKFMVHWKKVDGQWKMHKDIWNSSLPLPEPPAMEEAPVEE